MNGPYNDPVRIYVYNVNTIATILDETISMNGNQVFSTQKIIFPSVGSYNLEMYETRNPFSKIGTYSTKSVITGSALSYINIVVSPTSVSAYESFELQCSMTDGCGAPVTDKTLDVSSSTLTVYGTLTKTTSTNSATFSLYAISIGTYQVNVTSGSIFGTASITILTDVLKYYSISPSVINI